MKKIILLILLATASLTAQTLPNNIDISTSPNGVVALPTTVSSTWANNGFVKYTKLVTPNGQAIHFVAQNQLSDAQIVRSRNILEFYLTNVPNTQYGTDKTVVANKMAENDAILLLLNGADGEGNEPNLPGQYLFEDEIAVEGHNWYINNDFDHRDAAFEEILHLMHDTGIGVDGPNSYPGALPAYQTEIRAAQVDGLANNLWGLGAPGWIQELTQENSLSQEYLASVVDVYYGLWGAWTEEPGGMWGIYVAKTRAEMATLDPTGLALMPKYFSPFINVNMDIDPSFNGTFYMAFDASTPYTHKSQYLQHCTLTGSNASNLSGNDEYNRLCGNDNNNQLEGKKDNDRLDGKDGTDIAIFTGASTEYTISNQGDLTIVTDNTPNRDGIDTLLNIETIRFTDQDIAVNNAKNIVIFLEGATDFNTGLMSNNLQTQNLLPQSQPYNVAPYNYAGTEMLNPSLANFSIVDWVLVEMRSGTPSLAQANTVVVETKAGLLLTTGEIIGTDGNAITFDNLTNETAYHICIRHRNHLDILSNEPVIYNGSIDYDFTANITNAFGPAQQKLAPNGKAALWASDYTQDGTIQVSDFDAWRTTPAQLDTYSILDGNLDGVVQVTDSDLWFPNKAKIGIIEIAF